MQNNQNGCEAQENTLKATMWHANTWSLGGNANLDVWQRLWSHKSVHYEMATNVTQEFLSIIQKMKEVLRTMLS